MSYPIITDVHINEALKIEKLIPQVKSYLDTLEVLNGKLTFEYEINTPEFKGFVDLLEEVLKGKYNIYDFKYSNNKDDYMESKQLHVYKDKFEKATGFEVIGLYYIFIPKTMIRQKKTESLFQFRKRLLETLSKMNIEVVKVEFNPEKILDYHNLIAEIESAKEFLKKKSNLCNFCEFKDYCQSNGEVDWMIINKNKKIEKEKKIMNLPSTNRVEVKADSYKKIWLYGTPFSGKTTFADGAPTPINLNTDGNVKYVTMPRVSIKDEVTTSGRVTTRKFAWDVFKEAVAELEKGSDFKTIVVDLLEDTREHCRLYMYDKLGIEHESDGGYAKGYDQVRTEYLGTIRRLLSLPYNIILLSHEDTSKDLTKKTGDKITAIKPSIQDGLANKIAGMVDIVARVIIDEDDSRWISFKTKEVEFGGGRLQGIKSTKVALNWDNLCKVYEEALGDKPVTTRVTSKPVEVVETVEEKPVETVEEKIKTIESEDLPQATDTPATPVVRRVRKVRE